MSKARLRKAGFWISNMENKIKLKHDGHGDSRHAPKDTTFEQFHEANLSHIADVRAVML